VTSTDAPELSDPSAAPDVAPLTNRQPSPAVASHGPRAGLQPQAAPAIDYRQTLDYLVMSRSMSETLVRMDVAEVLAILVSLEEAGCAVWVAGGWGVDALVGHQTRPHRDLDLAVDANDESCAIGVLRRAGYQIETDWRPVRVELVAPGRGWVDLHPVVFGSDGHGRQADIGEGHFDYPPDGFTEGMIAGRRVRCISLEQQRRFHEGYEPRDIDLHDLALLRRHTVRTAINTAKTPDEGWSLPT
jgi:lincosamide nucleotidyltransferase A/C/D/E